MLAPGGRFLFFLNHPLLQAPNSGWVIDHILEEEYWRVGPYLPVDVTMEELAPGVILPFVHRPLSQYVNTMADHGLLIRADGRARTPGRLPGQSRGIPSRVDNPPPPTPSSKKAITKTLEPASLMGAYRPPVTPVRKGVKPCGG